MQAFATNSDEKKNDDDEDEREEKQQMKLGQSAAQGGRSASETQRTLERVTHKEKPAFAQCFFPLFSSPLYTSVAWLYIFLPNLCF